MNTNTENTEITEITEITEVAKEDQTMTIPKDYFVCGCDLDANPPICKIATDIDILQEKEILIPPALAYYLTTHFCGSWKMKENYEERAKFNLRREIKKLLDIS